MTYCLKNKSDEMLCNHEEVLSRKDTDVNMRIFDLQSRYQPERNRQFGFDVLVFDEMQFQNRDDFCALRKSKTQETQVDFEQKTDFIVPVSSSNTFVNGLYCKNDTMYEYNHQMFNNLTKQLPFSIGY